MLLFIQPIQPEDSISSPHPVITIMINSLKSVRAIKTIIAFLLSFLYFALNWRVK
jgi:hypothetical protein